MSGTGAWQKIADLGNSIACYFRYVPATCIEILFSQIGVWFICVECSTRKRQTSSIPGICYSLLRHGGIK